MLLANDPDFTVGTRHGGATNSASPPARATAPLRVQLLNGKAEVKKGDRLVTFGSQADKPFVPGVPVGEVVPRRPLRRRPHPHPVRPPFVGFSKLDIVGVVVQPPRKDPRDTVLPAEAQAEPTPTPTVTVTATADRRRPDAAEQ